MVLYRTCTALFGVWTRQDACPRKWSRSLLFLRVGKKAPLTPFLYADKNFQGNRKRLESGLQRGVPTTWRAYNVACLQRNLLGL